MPFALVAKNLFKHPLRALLTVASLAVALFLLCVLRSLVVALDAGVRNAAANRLIVQSSTSLFVYLPESYGAKLAAVEGVRSICKWNWFGGYYQEPKNFFAQFATDPAEFLAMYPEIEIVEGSSVPFLTERQACILGADTAAKYGVKAGDNFPLIGALFRRMDGEPWSFKVAGIYRSTKSSIDNNTLFFPYKYLHESIEAGAAMGPKGVGIFVLELAPGADRVQVASRVDALFEGGPQRTQTATEAEFNAQFVSMIGNVPLFVTSIGGGVMIAILLATLNTMLMAAREQTRDVGVLKALGFSDGSVFGLMLSQSMLLCVSGGALGIVIAVLSAPAFAARLGTLFPGYEVTSGTIAQAGVLTLAIGVFAGIVPALRARGLSVVTALRSNA